MLPFQARVDLGAMAIKGYSTFPKALALLEPHHQIVVCVWGILPLYREVQPQMTGQDTLRTPNRRVNYLKMIIESPKYKRPQAPIL